MPSQLTTLYRMARYGLPTACFHSVGRDLAMDEATLARLYERLDTETAAKELMADLLLHPEFPHYTPQNGARRQTLNLTMFASICCLVDSPIASL